MSQQFRLAAHLGTASVAYSAMVLSGLSVLRERALLKDPNAALQIAAKLSTPAMKRFRLAVTLLTALIFTTAMSGALVAGLDAGLIYNEFLYRLTPAMSEPFDSRVAGRRQTSPSLVWRGTWVRIRPWFNSTHRILATSTFTAILLLFCTPRITCFKQYPKRRESSARRLASCMMASLEKVGISTPRSTSSAYVAGGSPSGWGFAAYDRAEGFGGAG